MKNVLKLEELALFCMGIYCFSLLPFAWWVFPAVLLVPDIGMLGYFVSPYVGAFTYNMLHHRAIALLTWCFGLWFGSDIIQLAGIIMFTHIAMDRVLGYGLKYPDSFWHTHLGKIELKKKGLE